VGYGKGWMWRQRGQRGGVEEEARTILPPPPLLPFASLAPQIIPFSNVVV